jgi:ubiquinone/menaquinone biosynthesis C-methylase UbiE
MGAILNSDSWLSVWQRKGREAAGKAEYSTSDLLAADGFDGAMAQTSSEAQQHIAGIISSGLGLRPGMRVLEVGCGAGAVLSLLRNTQATFTGVDYSAPHIEIARSVLPETEFHVSEASSLPFSDNAFDAVFSYGVFLYFPDLPYAESVLNQLLRVAEPSAPVMILDIPDAAKREACEEARRAAGASLNPPHCYYPKHFFADFAAARGRRSVVTDQAVPGYGNSRFRFNVLLQD